MCVARLVGPHLHDLALGEVPARRFCERHHLEHGCVRPQHRAQRHERVRFSCRVEVHFAPAHLDVAVLPDVPGERWHALHQLGAIDHDSRMPSMTDDVQRVRAGARGCRLHRRPRASNQQDGEKQAAVPRPAAKPLRAVPPATLRGARGA